MADLNDELSAIMADFASKSVNPSPEIPAEDLSSVAGDQEQVPPVEEPKATDADVNEPVDPAATVEDPKAETDDEPLIIDEWDTPKADDKVVDPVVEPSSEIFNELGKALGLEKVSDKEALLTALKELKVKAETPALDKSQINPKLLKAIELDQKGGNWQSYLEVSVTDYSKEDPIELYENYVIDSLADETGNVNEEEVNKFLDNMTDAEKKLRGKELQRQLTAAQTQRVAEIERESILKREKNDEALKSALQSFNELNGFKVGDSHKRELFDWISSGKMMKDLFYDQSGNFDPNKTAKAAFIMRYFDKLDAYQKQRIKNATKREILADLSNPQISTPPKAANPTPKGGFGVDDYISQLEQLMLNK